MRCRFLPTGSAICADIMEAASAIKMRSKIMFIEALAPKVLWRPGKQVCLFTLKAKRNAGVFAKLATALAREQI